MKYLLLIATAVFCFSCQKAVDTRSATGSINGDVVQSNDGIDPFPCHATSFSTNYVAQPGKVPPFRFTKTQYPSGRIKTINMLSRANPNHPAFKPQAWELIGTFTYDNNLHAYFIGTKQLWEYFKTSTGVAGKRSILKKNVSLTFEFYAGFSGPEDNNFYGCGFVYNNLEKNIALMTSFYPDIYVGPGSDEPETSFEVDWESGTGDFTVIKTSAPLDYRSRRKIKFTYNLSSPLAQRVYQPTQNWISLEYTILEVMNWLPPPYGYANERVGVSVEFYPYGTSYKVVQSQVYKNHKYDGKGNLLSYTYGDNVLQKTAWVCKP